MAANVKLELDPLPVVLSTKPQTEEAARRLQGAHLSVEGLFTTLHALRAAKVAKKISIARLSHSEVDLLRAAIVFGGAGLDAVLKQLVRDALPELLGHHPSAQGALKAYSGKLTSEQPAKARSILMSPNPTRRLREEYIADLTKGSLQGHGELIQIRRALGLPDSGALSDISLTTFADFFMARNEVVHELDLLRPTGRGTFTRRYRRMDASRDHANSALVVTSEFVLGVDSLL